MTIRNILELSIEPTFQEFIIWDNNSEETVYEGTMEGCFYLDDEIVSIDLIDEGSPRLVFNIEIEEY